MSRFRRAFHGVASSYILLAATAVYSLASVPVALHYLDTERFGLWVLMGTLAGYLNLIDAGMTSAAGRLLIDHKDDPNGGNYGSLIKTGWLVSALQGLIIFVVGLSLAGIFANLLVTAPKLRSEFIQLINWQCGAVALLFFTRVFALILIANQRMDWANYSGIGGLCVNFIAQWIFFRLGFGVVSLALGSLAATLASAMLTAMACGRLDLFPRAGGWGQASWLRFRELFGFGKDVFLVTVGMQLVTASQGIIIARMLGLEAAGIWGVGVRVFNLLNQVIWRISDMSGAAFAEMLARGEMDRLRDRYRSMAVLTFSLAGWVAVSYALCNSLFVSIWTHGRIHWPVTNDWLLAVWMILSAAVRCHNGFVFLTKQIRLMPYAYFLEGVVFVSLAFLVARWGGLPAIIGCSILCTAAFSCAYGTWRVSHFFGLSLREVALSWLGPMIKVLLFYLPAAGLTWWLLLPAPDLTRLIAHALLVASLGAYLFLRFGIPLTFQAELLRRVPPWAALVLGRIFARTAG